MDEIERQVQLPADADELQNYARYYTFDGKRVIATYVASRGNDPLKGQRRWRAERLPTVMDGGCAVVNIIYDPRARKIENTYCNGLA